jgi:hypothetical protein
VRGMFVIPIRRCRSYLSLKSAGLFIQGLSGSDIEITHRTSDDDEIKKTKIDVLAAKWRDFTLLACLHFCADIFGVLADLSTDFQREAIDITFATDQVNKTKRNMTVNYLSGRMAWGKHTRRFLTGVVGLCDDGSCDELSETAELSLKAGA